MSNSKMLLFAVISCLSICWVSLAYEIPNPNLNNDGRVDFVDFGILAINWQQAGAGLKGDFDDSNSVDNDDLSVFCWYWLTEYSEYQQCREADLDNDGIIAFEDLAKFAQNWLLTGIGLAGDFDTSYLVDSNDLSVLADCWLKGTRPLDVWGQFKAALAVGDIERAVSFTAEISADQYRTFFQELEAYLPQMATEMGELIFIKQNEEMIHYDLLREDSGELYAYPVIFIKEEDGSWKIYDF